MKNTRFFAPLIATSALLILTACSSKDQSAGNQNTFLLNLDTDPTTLNAVTSTDAYASEIQGYIFNSLLSRDDETYDWVPQLAESYTISSDGTVFTFKLRDGVKWHDGKPLTAEDVKYSFDVYFEGRFEAPHMKPYLEGIKEVKIVDPKTIQFITKDVYFKNFNTAATLTIVPKHFYGVGDHKDPKFNKELIGTGPYTLSEWTRGQRIVLKKNPEYWGKDVPYWKERHLQDKILFRIVKEEAVSLELIKKGDLDFIGLTPEQYTTKTQGAPWGSKVHAVKAENSSAGNFSYGYVGWNGKHPFFKDRDARIAMSHLINREFMNEKFRYNMSELATGPFGNRSTASSPNVKPIPYDPAKAGELLKKNGWKLGPNGVLVKKIDGKDTPFEFTLLCANPDFEKYLTVMKEDVKKAGITMNIKFLEWNSFIKLVDERKFDAITMGWGVSDLEPDPKQIWHSASIPEPGHNFISYSNPEVDRLIDQVRKTMDPKARTPIFHKIHELIAADQPYSFLFNRKYVLYANTARVKKQKDSFKYSIGTETWKLQP